MIKVENVCKDFDGFRALSHLDMHVPKGSIYGLVGPNGAGKSTIIRHIVGAFRQDTGNILVDGEPIYENIEKKAQIAFIPDDIFYYTQANTLDMKHFYQGIYEQFDAALFDQLRECFPAVNVKKNIRNLSKGMQKQVAFWLAICCRPKLMILDEPVDGLDPVMRRQIWSLMMNDVAERETTVLVSSHNLRELEDVCDHVGIMDHGTLLLEHSLSELQNGISKIQIAFEGEMPQLPEDLDVVHQSQAGRVHTLIIRAASGVASKRLSELHPLLLDELPLTLEEIFIYELGGAQYAVKDILF